MADWRERGYVPDSDDEDEDDSLAVSGDPPLANRDAALQHSLGSQNLRQILSIEGVNQDEAPQPLTTPSITSVVERLETQLREGLQTVKEVLRASSNDVVQQHEDFEDDSPLSSPPSSVDFPLQEPVYLETEKLGEVQDDGPSNIYGPESNHIARSASGKRSFRPRAPIQLHPYAIEDARYRQTLQARGVKPIRSTVDVVHGDTPIMEAESQEPDRSFESSQLSVSEHSVPNPGPSLAADNESQSPIRGGRTRHHLTDQQQDDELPELSDLLQGNVVAPTQPRRQPAPATRINKTYANKNRSSTKTDRYRVYALPGERDQHLRASERTDDGSVFDIPPSPPRSRASTSIPNSSVKLNLQRAQGLATPGPLPTPIVSSDRSLLKRRSIQSSTSSDSDDVGKQDCQSVPEGSQNEGEESQQVTKVRKKIKGVLPASWLRLDFKKQNIQRQNHVSYLSPLKNVDDRGVARRVRSEQIKPSDQLSFSYEGVASDGEEINKSFDWGENDHISHHEKENRDLSEDETDSVTSWPTAKPDAELSRHQHHNKSKQAVRPCQTRLEDAWHDSEMDMLEGIESRPARPSVRNLENRHHGRKPPTKKIKRRGKSKKKTLLDVLGLDHNMLKKQPKFLKIAVRQHRSHVPTQGILPPKKPNANPRELSSPQVTSFGHGLDLYNSSHYAATTSDGEYRNEPQRRRHSQAYAESGRLRDTSVNGDLKALKLSTDAVLSRLLPNESPRESRVTVDNAQRQSGSSKSMLSYPILPHSRRNRSGIGHMLVRTGARSAQIENSKRNTTLSMKDVMSRTPRGPDATPQDRSLILFNSETSYHKRRPASQKGTQKKGHRLQPGVKMRNGPIRLSESDMQFQDLRNIADVDEMPMHDPNPIKTSPSGRLIRFAQEQALTMNRVNQRLLSEYPGILGKASIAINKIYDQVPTSILSAESIACELETLRILLLTTQAELFETDAEDVFGEANGPKSLLEILERQIDILNSDFAKAGLGHQRDFVVAILSFSEMILSHEQAHSQTAKKLQIESVLSIISRLLLITFQIGQRFEDIPQLLTECLEASKSKLVDTAIAISLRREHIITVCEHMQAMSNLDVIDLRNRVSPEIESLILVQQLSEISTSGLKFNLLDRCSQKQFFSDCSLVENLAYTMLVVCTILPLSDITMTTAGHVSKQRIGVYSWHSLISCIAVFLNDVTQNGPITHASTRTFGRVFMKWCHHLTFEWGITDLETLLRTLFKAYADNEMLDLFGMHSLKTSSMSTPSDTDLLSDDTDFDVFLKLAILALRTKVENAHRAVVGQKIVSQLRSLVFSLTPNNSKALQADQVLQQRDLKSITNCFRLYVVLYQNAPTGCKPRLRQIENLVDISTCHAEVCKVVLHAWSSITQAALTEVSDRSDLAYLAAWIQRLCLQLAERSSIAQQEVLQALVANGQQMSKYAEEVIQINQRTVNSQLVDVLQIWHLQLKRCSNEYEARILLNGDQLGKIIEFCRTDRKLSDEVCIGVLDLIDVYISICPSARTEQCLNPDLQQLVRSVMNEVLTNSLPRTIETLASLTETWFRIAKSMVDAMIRGWDAYLIAHSSLSFAIIADTQPSRQCKVLFVSRIIEMDEIYLDVERSALYRFWIESLLQPDDNLRFEHILTNQIVARDPIPLALNDLQEKLKRSGNSTFRSCSELVEHRVDILKHLLRHIYVLQFETDSFSENGLSTHDGQMLLQTICNTMKSTWRATTGLPREAWSNLIYVVLVEMHVYTYAGFTIDTWFTDPEEPEFPKNVFQLEDLFLCRPGSETIEIESTMIIAFRRSGERAVVHKQQAQWLDHLVRVFCCIDMDRIDDLGQPTIDIPLQTHFLQAIVPAYIECATGDCGRMLVLPIISCLSTTCANLVFRIDNYIHDNMVRFAFMATVALESIVAYIVRSQNDGHNKSGLAGLLLGTMLEFINAFLLQYTQMTQSYPWSDELVELQSCIHKHASQVHSSLATIHGWNSSRPVQVADFDAHSSPPELPALSNARKQTESIKEMAKRDLQNTLRTQWIRQPARPRADGAIRAGWLLHQGRSSTFVEDMVLDDAQVELFLSSEMRRFREIVEGLDLDGSVSQMLPSNIDGIGFDIPVELEEV